MKMLKKTMMVVMLILCATFTVLAVSCGGSAITATFETNGGNEIASIEVVGEELELPTPTRSGYEFGGWYASADFSGGRLSGKITVTESATYYAKWISLYNLTLDANGGTIGSSKFSLKEGDSVYAVVKDITPSYAHHEFTGWYNGASRISDGYKMPARDLTVSANYKVEYTVELYLQKERDSAEYVKAEENFVGYETAGIEFTANVKKEGYKSVNHANSLTKKTISENYTENVFRQYFDVESYRIVYNSNYPSESGLKDERVSEWANYGEKVVAPYDKFSVDGYMFAGWADESGELKYKVDYLRSRVENADGESVVADEIEVKENTYLYAVWSKGLYNLFGGNDVMYYNAAQPNAIYLERGGLLFKGTYNVNRNWFIFNDKNGNSMIEGKLLDEQGNDITADTLSAKLVAFALQNDERNNTTYNLYKVGSGVNNNIYIIFDDFNGITYSRRGQAVSEGKYYIDDNGYYVVTYYKGPLAESENESDRQMVIKTAESDDGTYTFQQRNEEELAMGTVGRGVIFNGSLYVVDTDYAYGLTFDGFGNATYKTPDTVIDFTYSEGSQQGEYNILENGNDVGVVRIEETAKGVKYYMFYDEEYNHIYTVSDDATLSVDGFNRVVYTKGETTVTAFYNLRQSVMNGNIVSFKDTETGIDYTFIITAEEDDGIVNENGQSQVTYKAEQRENNYAEYYFKDGNSIYYGPLVVFNGVDGDDIKAEIWMRTASASFAKVSEGIVTLKDGHYAYSETQKIEAEDAAKVPINFSNVKAFEFDVDSTTSNGRSYDVNFWYNYTDINDVVYHNELVFTSDKETFTLILPLNPDQKDPIFSNVGIYYNGSNTYKGEYKINNDGSVTFTSVRRIETDRGTETQEDIFYFRLNNEEKSLALLNNTPYRSAIRLQNGGYDNKYLYFDGTPSTASLVVLDTENGKEEQTYKGTISEVGKTSVFGSESKQIYEFTSEDYGSFRFIVSFDYNTGFEVRYSTGYNLIYTVEDNIITLYSDEYEEEYHSDDGTLRLDGFGGWAKYVGVKGDVEGSYTYNDGLITVNSGLDARYFDLNGEDFTVKGKEYGVYVLRNNHYNDKIFYEIDGYGKLKVFVSEDGSTKEYIDEDGSYVYDEATKVITLNYSNGSVTEEGVLGVYRDGNYYRRSFTPFENQTAGVYLNPQNWAVLVLDNIGNGSWFDENGNKGSGTYTVISDSLLYFADEDGNDGRIYIYNSEARTISSVRNSAHAYYTADFNSLVFTRTGFVVYNGERNNYYMMDGEDVIIFRQTGEGKYGFTEDKSFGKFESEKDYDGEHFYQSEGVSISFQRDPDRTENYRINLEGELKDIEELSFTPPGTKTFTNVVGDITVGGRSSQCFITREEDKMFVTFLLQDDKGNLGNYNIYIEATYKGGEGSTYIVTGVERSQTIYSSKFLSNYYLYYYYFGAAAARSYNNEFGTIKIVEVFDEEWELIDFYAEGEFGSASNFKDYKGNPLGFKAKYEVQEGEGQAVGTDFYTLSYVADDGFKYNVYFIVGNHPYMRSLAYMVNLFGREETLTTDDGVYEVTIERVAATDRNYKLGALARVEVKKNGVKVENAALAIIYGNVFLIERKEDGTATYYQIDIKLENNGSVEESEVLKIDSVSVKEYTSTTYKSEDGESFVDFVDGIPTVLSLTDGKGNRTNYIVSAYTHDEETGEYKITTSVAEYIVKIVDGKAVIEKVEEEKTGDK